MTGVEFMRKLTSSATDIPGEKLLSNRRLAIGREVLADNPRCQARQVVEAYRNYGFTVEKAKGKDPQEIADLMFRQNYIENTLAKVEQIYKDGEYRPEKLKPRAGIPIEDQLEVPVAEGPEQRKGK